MNPNLKMPFKRYAIGKVFRDGPIKLGRTREFYQCDADVVGSKSMLADAECIKIGVAGFNELEIPATISVNNRKLLEEILKKNGVKEEQLTDAMLTLDKIKKVGLDEVKKELKEKGISGKQCRLRRRVEHEYEDESREDRGCQGVPRRD
jgi:histidyl-tRNA synthetase